MNISKRLSQRKNNRLPMNGKVKKGFRTYCTVVIATVLAVCCFTVTAFAAEESGGNALTAINNLSTFIFGLIRAVGLILTGFGVVQIGLSLKSHDPSQRANGSLPLQAASSSPLQRKFLTSLSALNQNRGMSFITHTP